SPHDSSLGTRPVSTAGDASGEAAVCALLPAERVHPPACRGLASRVVRPHQRHDADFRNVMQHGHIPLRRARRCVVSFFAIALLLPSAATALAADAAPPAAAPRLAIADEPPGAAI